MSTRVVILAAGLGSRPGKPSPEQLTRLTKRIERPEACPPGGDVEQGLELAGAPALR